MTIHPYPTGKTFRFILYMLVAIEATIVIFAAYFHLHIQEIEQNARESNRILNERTVIDQALQKADADLLTRLGAIEGKMEILLSSVKIEGK
jgi:hypothetical protein